MAGGLTVDGAIPPHLPAEKNPSPLPAGGSLHFRWLQTGHGFGWPMSQLPDAKLRVSTILIAAGASLFFCSKSVFVKCAYRHGADYLTVLTLRMAFSLPFFLITGFLAARRRPVPLTSRQWAAMAGLGFLGYYLSSVLNFAGLTYTSVGLERIVLYSYPSLVVLGATVFFK